MAPIFGMPEDSDSAIPRPSLSAINRRQPPPAPPVPGQLSGPPSIGLEDSPHGELDLGGSGGGTSSLELDFEGGPGQRPMAEPPPEISLPSESGLDLPIPVDKSSSSPREQPNANALDLPAPVDADLPQPATSRPPAASRRAPASRPPSAGPPATALPSFSADLPAPVELDLPTPVMSGQPDEGLDLPIPSDLPTPGGQQMVAPAGLEVAPSNLGVAPSNLELAPSNLELAPANLEVVPADLELEPRRSDEPAPSTEESGHGVPTAVDPSPGVPEPHGPPNLAARVPAGPRPFTPSRPPVSRGLLIVVGGIAVLGLAGVGVLYSGILDPVDPEPAALRGNIPKKASTDEAKSPDSPATPNGPAVERSTAVLATMATHTPAAYLEARAAATKAGDVVGAAECALLLHYHYGPNPTLAAEANAVLKAHGSSSAGFVQRVIGLGTLAAGELDGAEKALVTDEPRARLYRGWLRRSQGKLDEAKADADAVLATLADEVSARHLVLAVAAQRDPFAAVPTLEATTSSPHPALLALLGTTAVQTGQLAIARTAVDALDPGATEDPGVQAWTHVQHARVRTAQGDHVEALAAFDRALALVPQVPSVQVDRIRTQLAARRFNDASSSVSALVRERPEDLEILLLQAEVAVLSGDGDIALQILDKLAKAMPKDARVVRWKGEVHAMRFEVEQGQAAFAAARALDPQDYRAAVGEATLLSAAKRLPDALTVLETARAKAEGAGRKQDVARLLVSKAELHQEAGETNAALEALERALEVMPTDNEARILRGVLRLQQGQVAEGRADLVEVFERTGGFPGLAGPLARRFVLESDFEQLERLVDDRLRGEQTGDDLLLVGVRLRMHQGRTDDAQALVQAALTRRPGDWEAHMLKAQLLIAEGKASEALAEIELSRPATPQPELMLQRGKILEFNARHDDAIPEYRHALELEPQLHEARFLFGRLLHYKGGHGKAITELRKVLVVPAAKSAPWFPEVWLNIGLAQQAQGKYADAIDSLGQATTIDPKLGEAWAELGGFHENLNKHGAAISALNKAVELGTKDDHWFADALMTLGRAQVKAGRKAAAKKSLEKFLEVASPESTSRAEAERLLSSL